MYYQDYEDYMRSVLGYPSNNMQDTYANNDYYRLSMSMQPVEEMEIENEDLYPEIYRIVNPMVCKACDEARGREITEDLANEITNNIYINIEGNEVNQTREVKNGDVPNPNAKQETRQSRVNNPLLRDLIKILVLRRLFERRRPRPPMRPPMPRPPFPGGNRPPMPRGYEDLYY